MRYMYIVGEPLYEKLPAEALSLKTFLLGFRLINFLSQKTAVVLEVTLPLTYTVIKGSISFDNGAFPLKHYKISLKSYRILSLRTFFG